MFTGNLGVNGIISFFAEQICSGLVWHRFISYGIRFGGMCRSLKIMKSIILVYSLFSILFRINFINKSYNFIR